MSADETFLRAKMLLGQERMSRLGGSHVAVFGLGGVGGFCAEALARSGVGRLTIIDQDTVSRTNINRQLCASESSIDRPKVHVTADRLLDINPRLTVNPIFDRYESGSRDRFLTGKYDFIVDAIDLVACKLDLIETALCRDIPIVSALGTGNKLDAARLEITDISKTRGCPLARTMRKELRRRGITRLTVVYSAEPALAPEDAEVPPPGRRSVPGSVVWVPACAGMLLAQHVVTELIK